MKSLFLTCFNTGKNQQIICPKTYVLFYNRTQRYKIFTLRAEPYLLLIINALKIKVNETTQSSLNAP